MKTIEELNSLGSLIKRARVGRELTLDDVVKFLPTPHQGKTKQWLHNIESDKGSPTVEALVHLHEKLIGVAPETSTDSLGYWLFKWAEAKVSKEDPIASSRMKAEEAKMLESDQRTVDFKKGKVRSLEFFPEAFLPLTVICGDRREPTPKTRGDLFAYSVSITDLTFILQLGLPKETRIRTDKLCVLLSLESQKRIFGKTNLLVLGSPAVNFASRIINGHAIFRFNLGQEVKQWEEQIAKLTHLNAREHLKVFSKMAYDPQNISLDPDVYHTNLSAEELEKLAKDVSTILGKKNLRARMNEFRQPGFIDPVDQRIHGQAIHEDNDFSVISIARNPYAEPDSEYVSIMAAGIHGPGSVQAVKALADKDRGNRFRRHPFGGIIEVQLNWSEQWADRLENADWNWQTHEYTPEWLLKNLEAGLPDFGRDSNMMPPLAQEEIQECVTLVRKLTSVASR